MGKTTMNRQEQRLEMAKFISQVGELEFWSLGLTLLLQLTPVLQPTTQKD